MERRLLTFIVASTAFFMFYLSLRMMFAPPPPPVVPGAEQVAEADGDELLDGENTVAKSAQAEETAAEEEPPPQRPEQTEWLTLGSMDPDSNYYMLVTLNSRGAGIERIELTERDERGKLRYRRVDVRHGYLGYFAAEAAENGEGAVVHVVGPGTPAEKAGIQVGDVIVSIAGKPIASRDDITQALIPSRPGDTITIEILRGESSTPQSLQATLSEHPLDLVRLAKDGGADQIEGNLSRQSCLLTLSKVNRKSIEPGRRTIAASVDPMELNWDVTRDVANSEQSVQFSLSLSSSEMQTMGGDPVRLVRSYALPKQAYDIDMAVQIDNLAEEAQDLAYRLEGANGLTLEGWWYSNRISPHWRGGAAARDVIYRTVASGHQLLSGFTLLSRAKDSLEKLESGKLTLREFNPNRTIFAGDSGPDERDMDYIGVDAQYFTVAYVPARGADSLKNFRRASAGIAADADLIPRHQERAVNTTFYLDSVVANVPPGASMRQELRLFAGPKQPDLLAEHGLEEAIYYGLPMFAFFSRMLGSLLHVLSGVGNYAAAIILLTLIVRACMFPLSRKAAINAQKMQELAPEIKKINEKYKDDMEGKLKAQRELQQRVGFNPLAGCLPMFLQLPIFIGLYRALSVDIELRQAAFFGGLDWASNLAGPDMFSYWGDWLWEYLSGRGTGWLGPYFNLLPVIVVVLFLLQQKMFMPPPTDEQTRMTAKMMNIMTLMMGLFFFRVPAGLCIYFITSSLWGICERILVKKTLPTTKHFDAALLDGTATATGGKSQSIAERIRSQVAKPEAPIERPNKRRRPPKKRS